MEAYKVIEIKKSVFESNDREAEKLRAELKAEKTFLVNLMSSPGSGKTTTLRGIIGRLQQEMRIGVMEADIDSDVDAKTIAETGVRAIQLHTGGMCHLDAGMTHSETLMPMIDTCLKTCGMTCADIDLYGVNAGPGSFTGLRIGLAAVKGLAFPRETLCAPVSTLEALAAAHTGEGTVLCALDARRAQVYSAAFDLATHQRLLEDDARAVADLAQFVENCKKPLFFVGDGASLCYNKYGSVPGVLQAPAALRGGRAAAVALVAKQMAEAGKAVLPEAVLPDYHRLSQAERERAERLAAEAVANAAQNKEQA